jgi:membrane associated rhomboid family serine protease
MVYVAISYNSPDLLKTLAVSPKTPWGVITSFFVHANESHLFNNMISLFFFLLLLIASNVSLLKKTFKKRIYVCFLIIFLIPIILNFVLIINAPEVTMIGSSGIVYALEGTCFGFSILNTLQFSELFKKSQKPSGAILVSSLSNLIICIGFLFYFLIWPDTFLGSVNIIIMWFHGCNFIGGTLSAILFSVFYKS